VTEWFGVGGKAKGRIGATGIDVGVDDDGVCCEMDAGQRTMDTFVRGGKGEGSSPGGVLARAPLIHPTSGWTSTWVASRTVSYMTSELLGGVCYYRLFTSLTALQGGLQ